MNGSDSIRVQRIGVVQIKEIKRGKNQLDCAKIMGQLESMSDVY